MWLCTQSGFFSITQKLPGEFHVRARMRQDLENLKDLCRVDWKIHRSPPPADYRYRCVVAADDVALIMARLAESIDYDNFKGRIHEIADQSEKSDAYSRLWGNLHALQR